jgi:hypothetical protein
MVKHTVNQQLEHDKWGREVKRASASPKHQLELHEMTPRVSANAFGRPSSELMLTFTPGQCRRCIQSPPSAPDGDAAAQRIDALVSPSRECVALA